MEDITQKPICGMLEKQQKVLKKEPELVGHKYLRRKKDGTYKHYKLAMAIKEYGWDSFESVILEEIDNSERDKINEREKFYIKEKNSFENGYNMTEGGDGIVLRGKDNPTYGRRYSEAERKIISERTKEAMKDPALRKHISESLKGEKNPNYGKHHSEETRNRISKSGKGHHKEAKKVYQYDLEGNFIKEFNSMYDIQELFGYDDSNIARCCKGKAQTAYGFKWRFDKI